MSQSPRIIRISYSSARSRADIPPACSQRLGRGCFRLSGHFCFCFHFTVFYSFLHFPPMRLCALVSCGQEVTLVCNEMHPLETLFKMFHESGRFEESGVSGTYFFQGSLWHILVSCLRRAALSSRLCSLQSFDCGTFCSTHPVKPHCFVCGCSV